MESRCNRTCGGDALIVLRDVCKSFTQKTENSFYALKNINLQIKDAECIVLSGISGSGKSTLLSIIGAIMRPTSGSVEIDGNNIVSLSDYHLSHYRNKTIGFVTQSFYLFENLSVKENLLAPLVINDLSFSEIDKKIDDALELANIAHKADQKASSLSGGEKQRCIVARALVNDPSIILCDEPTANLDRANSLHFMKIIKRLKDLKKTVIIATHDPLFNELDCVDRFVKIKEGILE